MNQVRPETSFAGRKIICPVKALHLLQGWKVAEGSGGQALQAHGEAQISEDERGQAVTPTPRGTRQTDFVIIFASDLVIFGQRR